MKRWRFIIIVSLFVLLTLACALTDRGLVNETEIIVNGTPMLVPVEPFNKDTSEVTILPTQAQQKTGDFNPLPPETGSNATDQLIQVQPQAQPTIQPQVFQYYQVGNFQVEMPENYPELNTVAWEELLKELEIMRTKPKSDDELYHKRIRFELADLPYGKERLISSDESNPDERAATNWNLVIGDNTQFHGMAISNYYVNQWPSALDSLVATHFLQYQYPDRGSLSKPLGDFLATKPLFKLQNLGPEKWWQDGQVYTYTLITTVPLSANILPLVEYEQDQQSEDSFPILLKQGDDIHCLMVMGLHMGSPYQQVDPFCFANFLIGKTETGGASRWGFLSQVTLDKYFSKK